MAGLSEISLNNSISSLEYSSRQYEIKFLLALQLLVVIVLLIAYFGIPIMRSYISTHSAGYQISDEL